MTRRILAALMALLLTAGGAPAFAADCGDTAGPSGERVACDCGDTVITNTTLKATDPVVNNFCSPTGLDIGADGIKLNCAGLAISGEGEDGIAVHGRTGVEVRNCGVSGFFFGIHVGGGGGNVVTLNTLTENGIGVDLDETSGNVVKANTITSSWFDGINLCFASGNLVENNVITGGEEDGVDLECSSSGNTVKGNQISGFVDDGIEVEEESNGNTITENRISDTEDGIDINSDGNVVARNLVENARDDGIDVDGDDNTVDGNRVKGSADNGVEVTGSGNTLVRNVADDNGAYGVCAVAGNTNGGGNRGNGNGMANVEFDCVVP